MIFLIPWNVSLVFELVIRNLWEKELFGDKLSSPSPSASVLLALRLDPRSRFSLLRPALD